MKEPLITPVLFLIYNRPFLAQRVLNEIRKARPKKLFVSADGPKDSEADYQKCQAARGIIKQVDWDCEVIKNYSDVNLGCRRRIPSSLDWLFSEVEEAIILEDDCLPRQSFFYFCQDLLAKYRDDKRIASISGNNFQFGKSRTNCSYYFSKYPHIWGWATWRRSWQYYDADIKTWPECKKLHVFYSACDSMHEYKYRINIFDRVYRGEGDEWGHQWGYACLRRGSLSILPNVNLVSNIGFGPDGAHCKNAKSPIAALPTVDIWDLVHPESIVRNREADIFTFDYAFGRRELRGRDALKEKVKYYLGSAKLKVETLLWRFFANLGKGSDQANA